MCLNDIYIEVRICEHLPNALLVQNALKQDALSPLLFNFPLECAIKKIQEIKGGL
jgi:uncharacterized protein (DUF1499 family)